LPNPEEIILYLDQKASKSTACNLLWLIQQGYEVHYTFDIDPLAQSPRTAYNV